MLSPRSPSSIARVSRGRLVPWVPRVDHTIDRRFVKVVSLSVACRLHAQGHGGGAQVHQCVWCRCRCRWATDRDTLDGSSAGSGQGGQDGETEIEMEMEMKMDGGWTCIVHHGGVVAKLF